MAVSLSEIVGPLFLLQRGRGKTPTGSGESLVRVCYLISSGTGKMSRAGAISSGTGKMSHAGVI